ncbi:MAG: hypothetical protein GKS00_14870 [Alphaproteobacteria bacterium]|nr:hypothetical protein [Alphaproteobacteria bacterium]
MHATRRDLWSEGSSPTGRRWARAAALIAVAGFAWLAAPVAAQAQVTPPQDEAFTPKNTLIDIDVLANDGTGHTINSTASVLRVTEVGSGSTATVGTATIIGSDTGAEIRFEPNTGFVGSAEFTYVTVAPGIGGSNTVTVFVRVLETVVITTEPADVTVTPPAAASFTAAATGGGTLSYQWQRDGEDISGATSATYTLDPTALADNGAQFQVVVSNAAEEVTSAAAILTINARPSFTLPADPNRNQTVAEDAGDQTVTGFASAISAGPANESGQVLTFNVEIPAAGEALFSAAPAIDLASGNLSYTPADDANGTTTVTLTDDGGTPGVTADDATSAAQTFDITIDAVNDPPTIVITAETLLEDRGVSTATVAATYVATDEDGDTLTVDFTAGTNTDGHYTLDTDNAEVKLTDVGVAAVNLGGPLSAIALSVDDGTVTATATATPTVTPVNDPPTIVITAETLTEDGGATVAATYVAADEENASLTVTFTVGTNTNGYYELDTDNAEVELTADGAAVVNAGGTLSAIELTVTDGDNATATATATPTVTPVNDPPTIVITAETLTEDGGATVAATYVAADEENASLTVTFTVGTNTNGYYELDTDNAEVELTADGAEVVNAGGTLSAIELTVTDGDNATATATATPTVTPVNDPPTIVITAETLFEDGGATVAATYVAADEETTSPTVTLTANPHYTLDTDNAEVELTADGAAVVNAGGTLSAIELTVTDGDNATATATATPTVTPVNDPPTIVITAETLFEDGGATVAATYVAADEETTSPTVTLTATPQPNTLYGQRPRSS